LVLLGCFLLLGCAAVEEKKVPSKLGLRLLGELIMPSGTLFDSTMFGGLSSIDYQDGQFYLICDDGDMGRFYTMEMDVNETGIVNEKIKSVTLIRDKHGNPINRKGLDPEGLRYQPKSNSFFWIDEGKVKKEVSPKLQEMNGDGHILRALNLPTSFEVKSSKSKRGPRQNKSLESLALSLDGNDCMVAMEAPLKEDGSKPKLKVGHYPVRMARIDIESGEVLNVYAYNLEPIARPKVEDGVALNGLSEIMCFDSNSMLMLERSFSAGYEDGGNDVKIFRAFFDDATDIRDYDSLKDQEYKPLRKELFFDFNSIRSQLTNKVVDNIEGICFGPKLSNGNMTIMVVADDNFGVYGDQMNQFIAFEVLEN